MKSLKVVTLVIALAVGLSLLPLIAQQAGSKGGEQKININTASLSELQKLPRIGPQVAQRIIDYRKEHGNFKKIEEIMKVRGIGEKTYNQLKDLITVGAEITGK
ncbi:MAG: helix-hairpin-helix domain-containing protein [Clostridiales bacterium]|nr:helix-hairpin-helix domain-containing protein [Clostridiales bacterium]